MHSTCLSGSGLELAYGSSRKRVVGMVFRRRLSIGRRLVLMLVVLIVCGLRIDIRWCAMTLRRRWIRIAMLFVMGVVIMLSRLLIGDRMIDGTLLLM